VGTGTSDWKIRHSGAELVLKVMLKFKTENGWGEGGGRIGLVDQGILIQFGVAKGSTTRRKYKGLKTRQNSGDIGTMVVTLSSAPHKKGYAKARKKKGRDPELRTKGSKVLSEARLGLYKFNTGGRRRMGGVKLAGNKVLRVEGFDKDTQKLYEKRRKALKTGGITKKRDKKIRQHR